MEDGTPFYVDRARAARAARADVEAALGSAIADWPWSPRLSHWVDVLVAIEDTE